MKLFEARVMAVIVLAIVGMWTMSTFEYVDDLSAYRGGTDCMQVMFTNQNCDSYDSTCDRCTSSGLNDKCVCYVSETTCVYCNDNWQSCGGTHQTGEPLWYPTNPPKWYDCINWQDVGDCGKMYNTPSAGSCLPKTC